MHLRSISIENFRAINRLNLDLDEGANLLIGPNAVGKTTVLEALRLCKATLAPRTQSESRAILVALGVTPQNLPNVQNFSAISNERQEPIKISCKFGLSQSEVTMLPAIFPDLVRRIISAQTGISLETGQTSLIQFMSSPNGIAMKSQVDQFVQQHIARLTASASCDLLLQINPTEGSYEGGDLFAQTVFSVFESRLSPFKSLFSFFPADRAMPTGDIPIQLGSVDAQQQLESHNSQPSLKYQRLKTTIFSALLEGPESRKRMEDVFGRVFNSLLKERELVDFSVNQFGQASITVRDTRSGKVFDIDSMSSGEKGLILLFVTLDRSIENGGLVLLDEPELHLNPAVCKDLLTFLDEEFLKPRNMQALICTHSPEILGAAMRIDKAKVFHLRQGGMASVIRKQDQPEVAQALKLLGTSEVEEMLYQAVVFVEGPDDVELLETAFPKILSRVKFRDLAGRKEVEKQIVKLQEAEKNGTKEGTSYFLFDRDDRPSNLTSSNQVKIEQWSRYCLENYLLDQQVLYDVLRKDFAATNLPTDLGSATQLFEQIAKRQLRARAIDQAYEELDYENPGLRPPDRSAGNYQKAAEALFGRLSKIRQQVTLLNETTWKNQFIERCEAIHREKEQEWSSSWITQCSGKQFFKDLYQTVGLNIKPIALKRHLLKENKFFNDGEGSESWKLLKSSFDGLFEK
ncbi:ATP-dependent endonuclease [Terriglobus sp. RCC_193]|uniref:ATP-dependent nuclease n=1 Tax=Terriglobus sp. RCC_193 TaxID=3239218 RepID=UPI00352685D2